MITQTLPPNPCLENLRNQAKTLKTEHANASPEVLARIKENLPRAAELSESEIVSMPFALHDAQLVIAREYGFESWPKLKHHVEPPDNSKLLKEAIDTGDKEAVTKLIKEEPALLKENLPVNRNFFGRDIEPLTYACFRGEIDIVKELVKAGADPSKDNYGCLSSMHFKSFELWKFFVERGMDVNKPVLDYGLSLLSILLDTKIFSCENITWLLEHGADPNLVTEKVPFFPLDILLLSKSNIDCPQQKQAVDILLQAGAKSKMMGHPVFHMLTGNLDVFEKELAKNPSTVNAVLPDMSANGAFNEDVEQLKGWTMMHLAFHLSNYEAVKILLSKGADLNVRARCSDSQYGITPAFLSLASMMRLSSKNEDRLKLLEFIITSGADCSLKADIFSSFYIQARNKSDALQKPLMNMLDFALVLNKDSLKPAIDLLLAHGAKPSNLYGSARLGLVSEVKKFLQAGADPNERFFQELFDATEVTPISAAAANGHDDVCEILLNAGAENTISALDAARAGNVKILEHILDENPSQMNLRGEMQWMPLHQAAIHNHPKAVELLLSKGADIDCRDLMFNTPLHKALENDSKEVIKLLISCGADIHAKNTHRATPLIHGVWAGASLDTIKLLIENGANINDKNMYGTVLDVARLWGRHEIADYLEKLGAESKESK